MELMLTLPILILIVFAALEFSLLFFARGSVVEASRTGARIASLHGADRQDVVRGVRTVLPLRLRKVADVQVQLTNQPGHLVAVGVRVPMQQAAPDLLWPIGFSLQARSLSSQTRMLKE